MTREVVKDIGNKSREFFEFILPPVDFIINDDKLIVKIDVPGFDKTEIDLSLEGQILSIHAEKNEDEVKGEVIWKQRPKKLEKKIKIPVKIDDSKGKITSAKFMNGVLVLSIPVHVNKTNISIE